jgi:hypothetical protein
MINSPSFTASVIVPVIARVWLSINTETPLTESALLSAVSFTGENLKDVPQHDRSNVTCKQSQSLDTNASVISNFASSVIFIHIFPFNNILTAGIAFVFWRRIFILIPCVFVGYFLNLKVTASRFLLFFLIVIQSSK